MRWVIPKKPVTGETRTTKKFAWIPTEVPGYTIWLEYYIQVERFSRLDGWYVDSVRLIEEEKDK